MSQNYNQELKARTADLAQINQIYLNSTEHNHEHQRGQLLNEVKGRNEKFHTALQSLTIPEAGDVPGINQGWQDEILRIASLVTFVRESLLKELDNRTNDLAAVIEVLKGNEPQTRLDEILGENQNRHNEQIVNHSQAAGVSDPNEYKGDDMFDCDKRLDGDNQRWEDLIKSTAVVPPIPVGEGDFPSILTQALAKELTARNDDMDKLRATGDPVPVKKACDARHTGAVEVLAAAAENDEGVITEDREKLLDEFDSDNKRWSDGLGIVSLPALAAVASNPALANAGAAGGPPPVPMGIANVTGDPATLITQQRDYAREEMQGRIDDLTKLRTLFKQKEAGDLSEEGLVECVADLVGDIRERHKDIETHIGEVLTPADLLATVKSLPRPDAVGVSVGMMQSDAQVNLEEKQDPFDDAPPAEEIMVTPMQAYQNNDIDWRAAFEDMIRAILGVEPPPEVTASAWWLDKDPARVTLVDAIIVQPENQEELMQFATYLDRVLALPEDELRSLYMPVKQNESDELDNHHILSTFFDGSMVGQFLDVCEPDFMDTRVIHPPEDMEEPYPLPISQVEDNVQLSLSSSKALGIRLPSYEFDGWTSPDSHVPVLLKLLKELTLKQLSQYVNRNAHPEIVRLAADDEDSETIQGLTPYDWIPRWMNRTLKRPLKTPIEDFNPDLYLTMAAIDPEFTMGGSPKNFDNTLGACEHMINFAKTKLGVDTNVQPQDLLDNNRKCQDLFAAQVFHSKSGIQKLSKKEQNRFKSIVMDDSIQTGDESMANFINTFLPPEYAVRSLKRDLSDGVVIAKILDKVKPGCIDWKKIRDRGSIRHKFDKMGNCNYAMTQAKGLNLKLVGAAGQDLHDGNQKVIHSLLWQIMRFQAIKALSDLSFGGKQIEDKDILAWANETVGGLEDAKSNPIRNFKDKSLTTGIFYIEILKVILGDGVQDKIVYWDVPPMADLRRDMDDEETLKKRLGNARYAMTLARREGAELFVLPEDLIRLEAKAVLSVFAGLMTIFFEEEREKLKANKKDGDVDFALTETGYAG